MAPDPRQAEALAQASELALAAARRAGADHADVLAEVRDDFEVKVADHRIQNLSQAMSRGLGLRAFVGGRVGTCTTSDFAPAAIAHAVGRAVQLAREASADPHQGLADLTPGELSAGLELALYDPAVVALATADKIAWAHELEAAARAVDPRVKTFRDSGVSTEVLHTVLATSTGAIRRLSRTGIAAWSTPVAAADGELQTEAWYDAQAHLADLQPLRDIGRIAGERAVRMLGARPVATQRCPVIFEPALAFGLVAGMLGALDGDQVRKGASFLAGREGQLVAAPGLTLIDDPLMPRGGSSTPFDGEGLPTARRALVDAGRLTGFLYDATTARRVGVAPTGSARRGVGGLPHAGTFNPYVAAGSTPVRDILRELPRALLVTRGLGQGVDTVTGNYSRGAGGLWLSHGEVVHPVQEITIAGDFLTMLASIDAVGDDLLLRGGRGAPTLRLAEMTVSGR